MTYPNGCPVRSATAPVDQQGLRDQLRRRAEALAPGYDVLNRPLRPESARTDALARACLIFAQRLPSEYDLGRARYALDVAQLVMLSRWVFHTAIDATRGLFDQVDADDLRRALLAVSDLGLLAEGGSDAP